MIHDDFPYVILPRREPTDVAGPSWISPRHGRAFARTDDVLGSWEPQQNRAPESCQSLGKPWKQIHSWSIFWFIHFFYNPNPEKMGVKIRYQIRLCFKIRSRYFLQKRQAVGREGTIFSCPKKGLWLKSLNWTCFSFKTDQLRWATGCITGAQGWFQIDLS